MKGAAGLVWPFSDIGAVLALRLQTAFAGSRDAGGRYPRAPDGFVHEPRKVQSMATLNTIELKAFVPAKDFALSKQFYQDLGFTIAWSDDDLAYLRCGDVSFLLQNYYVQELADNFMMHLLVEDVDAWWTHVEDRQIARKYGVKTLPPEERPWKMRDFVIIDPSGVLWRVGQNTR